MLTASVKFEILMAVTLKIMVFWTVTPCIYFYLFIYLFFILSIHVIWLMSVITEEHAVLIFRVGWLVPPYPTA
jgi:hypothetical protein